MRTRLLPLLLAVALGLAACTGGDPTPSPSPTAGAGAGADINARDRGALQRGGTLRQAVTAIDGSWNPLATDGTDAELDRIRDPLLPRFFDYDAAGVPTPDPDFLISATQTAASPTTITYQLNPKAVWGDGSPVDGDDMIATWKACNGSDPAFRCARTDAYGQIASVTTGADKFSVTVTFKATYPDWTGVFDDPGVLKAESVADAATFNSGWSSLKDDWLSGPFRFEAYDTGAGVFTAVPNDRWWGDPPMLDQLLWRVLPADQQAQAYADHRIDSYDALPSAYAAAKALPATDVRIAPGRQLREVVINTAAAPLSDLAIRLAVAGAIDRSALVAADLQGTDLTVTPLGNHLLLPGQPGYTDHGTAPDAAKAQAALDAAGWTVGTDGTRTKDGQALALTALVDAADPLAVAEARLLGTQLSAVGVALTVSTVSASELDQRLRAGEHQLVVRGRPADRSIGQAVARYTSGSSTDVSRLELPAYDDLARQIGTLTETEPRLAAVNQADVALWGAAPALPLYQRPDLVITPPTLANFGAPGLGTVPWSDVGYLR